MGQRLRLSLVITRTSPYLFSSDLALTQISAGSFTLALGYRPKAFAPVVPENIVLAPAFKIVVNSDATVTFTINNSPSDTETSVTSTSPIVDDWNQVVVVYDLASGVLTMFLNGNTTTQAFSSPADSSESSYSINFQLGDSAREDTSSGENASFDLDEVSAWARVLTAAELAQLYGGGDWEIYPFLGGAFDLVFQGELINVVEKPLVLGSSKGLWFVDKSFDITAGKFTATLTSLYFNNPSTTGFSWSADNFNDKIIFAQHDNRAQYWTPPLPTVAQDLPGLPTDGTFNPKTDDALWDGVTVFANHALLWKNDRIKWSDLNDFSLWIPVAETAVSTVLTLSDPFVQPAVGGNISVNITNPTTAVLSISLDGDLAFGSVTVGTTAQQLLSIINTGTADITVTGISLPDGFTGSFAGVITAGNTQPVLITFAPTEAISYDGAVTVASNATTGTSVFPVSGQGAGLARVIVLGGVLNFGVTLAGNPISSTLIINNAGNDTLTISGITVPSGITLGTVPPTVAAGARALVTVTWNSVGTLNDNIVVDSDATSGTPSILVSGTGGSISDPNNFATDNGTCQFGNVPVGTTVTGTIRVTSLTTSTGHGVNFYAPALPPGFSTTFTGPANVAGPGGFVDIPISFTPTLAQAYGGPFTILSSGPTPHGAANGSATCLVSGVGTATGKIILVTGNLAFGDTPTNGSSFGLLTIANIGTVDLTVTSISLPSGFSGDFAGVVAAGTTKNIQIQFSPTSAITFTGTVTVNSDATGTNTVPISGTGTDPIEPATLAVGQVVSLQDVRGTLTYYNYYSVVSATNDNLVLQLLSLTGVTPAGLTMPADGRQFFTVDANESGEDEITGAKQNGPIFKVVPQGDYAYSFKERSIQSIQYVGLGSGVFFVHNEVSGEGLISRDAITDRGDGMLVFLGHKELYTYQGGPNLQPVCQQTTRELYKNLDRSRLYAIRVFHNENRKEIWVQYPIVGGFKVLIWNYIEDSSSIDDYDPGIEFTGLGLVDWPTNEATGAVDHVPLLASKDGNIRVHGLVYNRDGEGYLSVSETQDFDFQNPDLYKYVDVVVLGLDVKTVETTPRLMTVQIGSQASLSGGAITWTAPQQILVNGQAPVPVKVNPGGAGRYLRVRFTSSDPDVQWRVSSFEIHCRPGGFY